MTPNVSAFLTTVSHSEGTDRVPDPYRCCYSFRHTIQDLNYHPACPRPPMMEVEWQGESLESLGPAYKGLISTAAGRYQITKHTWMALQAKLNLPDFTDSSQDDAAIQLIKEKGALDLLYGGKISEAITACRGIWASLPGSDSGQPQARMADLINVYGNAGGNFA